MVGGDHSRTVWLVRVSIVRLWVEVIYKLEPKLFGLDTQDIPLATTVSS